VNGPKIISAKSLKRHEQVVVEEANGPTPVERPQFFLSIFGTEFLYHTQSMKILSEFLYHTHQDVDTNESEKMEQPWVAHSSFLVLCIQKIYISVPSGSARLGRCFLRLEELLGDAAVLMMGWGNPDLLGNWAVRQWGWWG
jgi:hypothetical protein